MVGRCFVRDLPTLNPVFFNDFGKKGGDESVKINFSGKTPFLVFSAILTPSFVAFLQKAYLTAESRNHLPISPLPLKVLKRH